MIHQIIASIKLFSLYAGKVVLAGAVLFAIVRGIATLRQR